MKIKIIIIFTIIFFGQRCLIAQNENEKFLLKKIDVQVFNIKNEKFKDVLDKVIFYKTKTKYSKQYKIYFEKSNNGELIIIISLITEENDLFTVPEGILFYENNNFFIYGDYSGILKKKTFFHGKNKHTIELILYEIPYVIDTIDWYFKYINNEFELIKINEYGFN